MEHLCQGLPAADFNPRSPWGERPPSQWYVSTSCSISIHAPRGGSDPAISPAVGRRRNFNPRSPWGERQRRGIPIPVYTDFNPRSPWGERPGPGEITPTYICISIHAPRGGSDGRVRRMPRGSGISIHAPRGGSDHLQTSANKCNQTFQSTLPVGGATRSTGSACPPLCNFNPRSPWGERLNLAVRQPNGLPFQSTLPVGGATL